MAAELLVFLSLPLLSGNTRASKTKSDLPGGVLKSKYILSAFYMSMKSIG